MKDEFEQSFEPDDTLTEFDQFIESIRSEVEENDAKTSLVNPYRFQEMKYAYSLLKEMTSGMEDVKLTYEVHSPAKYMGNISLEGQFLYFAEPQKFKAVAALASNTEVYALSKNAVRLTFTFHGLTRNIE